MTTTRTLGLKLHVDEKRGLCMTVVQTVVEVDDNGEKETTRLERTDAWLPSSICSAATELITEYLANMGVKAEDVTPIEQAIGEASA